MSEAFFISGLANNACTQSQSITVSSEDSLFPKSNLQTGKPWEPFRFGTLDTNPTVTFDTNIVANPSFEDDIAGASPPQKWQIPTGGGSPDVDTTAANEGTKSLRLNLASEAAFQDRVVRSGGTYRISVALRGDGTNIVSAYVQDLLTGKWLQSGGTWTTTKTAWATRSAATFATSNLTFTLETQLVGHYGSGKIRILFDRPGSITGAAYVDSVYVWPKITCAALIYDTIPSGFTIAVQSDDNSGFASPTANGNLPTNRYRKYLTFVGPATPERYWRFSITGTLYDLYKPWIGQAILGERETFITNPTYGIVNMRKIEKAGISNLPVSLSDAVLYGLEMEWAATYSDYQQVAEKLFAWSYFGDEPVLIVPDVTKADMVYGRGMELSKVESKWELSDFLKYSLEIDDDPFPVFTK